MYSRSKDGASERVKKELSSYRICVCVFDAKLLKFFRFVFILHCVTHISDIVTFQRICVNISHSKVRFLLLVPISHESVKIGSEYSYQEQH